MNGPTRKKRYRSIAQGDGEFCRGCGALPTERQLIVDHRDNDNSNNKPDNLQLLCRACNYIKNPRRPVDVCVSEDGSPAQSELEVNRAKEPLFRRYVLQRINEEGPLPESDLINAGAEHVCISPVTAKRYTNKLCSKAGICQRSPSGKTVVIDYKKDLALT